MDHWTECIEKKSDYMQNKVRRNDNLIRLLGRGIGPLHRTPQHR